MIRCPVHITLNQPLIPIMPMLLIIAGSAALPNPRFNPFHDVSKPDLEELSFDLARSREPLPEMLAATK